MDWLKVKDSDYEKVQIINPIKGIYLLNLSPRPYTPTEEDGEVNCEVISVKVEKIPDTVKLNQLLQEIQAEYDKSDEVNYFTLNGAKCWLDKDTRVGLINSITIQKDSGVLVTNLWLNGKPHAVSVDYALTFLRKLELYAVSCYNVTQLHLSEIKQTTNRDALFNYNVSAGYPTPIEFDDSEIIKI